MPVKNYKDELLKDLRNPREAAAYLNACFQDSEEVFLQGLKNVVEARGGMTNIANITDLNRENLYRTLSKKGNPKLSSLSAILEAVGITLTFKAQPKRNFATS
jgi:probable addiction module antidote protein